MHYRLAVLTVILAVLGSVSARADAIDGNWCREGRHLSIKGPQVVTPDGQTLKGIYERHAFAYQVPAGATGAGTVFAMQMVSETEIVMRVVNGAVSGTPESWKRCEITS